MGPLIHRRNLPLFQAGEALLAALAEGPVEEGDRGREVDGVERHADPEIGERARPFRQDAPHPFEDVGRREAPGNRPRPLGEDFDGIEDGAEGGEEEGDHEGEHLHLVAPVDDGARGDEADHPAENNE